VRTPAISSEARIAGHRLAEGELPGPSDGKRKILSIDPGTTTGFALYTESAITEKWNWTVWELPYSPNLILEIIEREYPSQIVAESYTLGNFKSKEIDGIKVLGIVDLIKDRNPSIKYHEQPSQHGRAITDTFVKAHGLWAVGMKDANSATRHLLHFLIHQLGQKHWLNVLRASERVI
jgi:hypothetical protein